MQLTNLLMKKSFKILTTTLFLTPVFLACFTFSQMAYAETDVSPPPDGGYAGFTTAEGQQALKNLSSGIANSAFGWRSLFDVTTASYNTGLGAGTLALNTGEANTATGVASLILNMTGTRNIANGAAAMVFNDDGDDNAAVGYFSLYNNTSGNSNSGLGTDTLISNTTGDCNIALGDSALVNSTTGDNNIGIGCDAGSSITTGSNNIYIANLGEDDESNTIRIGDPAIHTKAYVAGIPAGGLAAILFDYNNGTIVIGVGGPVAFNQAPLVVGTAITKTNDTTFTVHANGVYRVSYTLRTALLSLLGGVRVQVNGVGVGPTASLVVAGTPLSDQVTFQANAGDTVQLVVSGVALTLAAGDNATINLDKIQ
jgi:BclA C-terminal domain